MDEKLRNLYYNPSSSGSFGGVDRLFNEARRHIRNLKKTDVEKFLKKQIAYTIHKDLKRKFPRNKIIVTDIDEQWQVDLVDMSMYANQNDGFKYILTVIDILSKFAWAVPLKNKSANSVLEAFKKILSMRIPEKIQSDKGGEFVNKQIKDYFNEKNINFFVSQNDVLKAPVIERFNRTLKERMFRYFTATGNRRYIDKLDDFVISYNNTKHSTIKMTPTEASTTDRKYLLQNVYGTDRISSLYKLERSDQDIGQTVRLQKQHLPFAKGYLPKWTEETFTVTDINRKNQPMYSLIDYHNKPIIGKPYKSELQSVLEDSNTFFRVEKILASKGRGANKSYLVKWLGYPDSFNSYVKASDLANKSSEN